MSKVERVGQVEGKSATEVYESSIPAYEAAGFDVWKKRPLGWLSLAKMTLDGVEVDSNFAVRPTFPVSYTLTISAEGFSEDRLAELADRILAGLDSL
jgi:hypothetical protein